MYRNYMHVIRVASLSMSQIFTSDSKGILNDVLRKIVSIFSNDPQMYFFVTAFFIVGVHLFTIYKYTDNVYIATILFYTAFGFFTSNNITRQYVAICIVMLGWKYIIEQNLLKYLICVMIAAGFHASALITIPLYFLSRIRVNRILLFVYLILGFVFVLFNRQLTAVFQMIMYENYGEGYGSESSNPLRLVWSALAAFSVFLISRRPETGNRDSEGLKFGMQNNAVFHSFLCQGTVLDCFFSVMSTVNMLLYSRIAAYFSGIALLTIIHSFNRMDSRGRRIYKFGVFSLAIAWFVVMNISGKLIPTPYTPFWEFPWRAMIR